MKAFMEADEKKTKEQILNSALMFAAKKQFDFPNASTAKKMAAMYFHHRYLVPVKELDKCIPSCPKEVPMHYLSKIDGVYVDDFDRKIRVMYYSPTALLLDIDGTATEIVGKLLEMMEKDTVYDYSKIINKVSEAISEGYGLELICRTDRYKKSLLELEEIVSQDLGEQYVTFRILTPMMVAEATGLRMERVESGFNIYWRD